MGTFGGEEGAIFVGVERDKGGEMYEVGPQIAMNIQDCLS